MPSGNWATDISVETSRISEMTYLAMRRGAHVIPRGIAGKPTDELAPEWMSHLPLQVTRWFFVRQLKQIQEEVTTGLPKPDHKLGEAHPTISSDLLPRIGRRPRDANPNIARIDQADSDFVDGWSTAIDTIVE